MKQMAIRAWARAFARPGFARVHQTLIKLGLHGLGILNYQDDLSGERAFLRRQLGHTSRPIVVDVGAHSGEYANLVLSEAPKARLISIEPHPQSYGRLAELAHQHKFQAIQSACGAHPGVATLNDYVGDASGSQHASLYKDVISSVWGSASSGISVEVTTIDALAARLELDMIDLLKIDTEGAELDVLRGAKGMLDSGRIRSIQFEFNDTLTISRAFLRDFRELLTGFRLYRLLPDGLLSLEPYQALFCEIFAYQNIVALPYGATDGH